VRKKRRQAYDIGPQNYAPQKKMNAPKGRDRRVYQEFNPKRGHGSIGRISHRSEDE